MKLVYFSWIRERIGFSEEEVDLPDTVSTVSGLLTWLKSRGEAYETALQHDGVVRVALNHEHVADRAASLAGVREVALFPPMTGG